MYSFNIGFFPLSNMHVRPPHVFSWLINHFILGPSNIPLPGCTTACLSIHLPEDTSVTASVFKLAGHGSVLSRAPWLHEDQTVPHLLFCSPQPRACITVERKSYGSKKMKILILCQYIFEVFCSARHLNTNTQNYILTFPSWQNPFTVPDISSKGRNQVFP